MKVRGYLVWVPGTVTKPVAPRLFLIDGYAIIYRAFFALLVQDGLLTCAAILVPAMLGGFYLGNRLHALIPAASVVRVIYSVLVMAGLSLLFRSAA